MEHIAVTSSGDKYRILVCPLSKSAYIVEPVTSECAMPKKCPISWVMTLAKS